ncbi:hypothetical protein DJ485_18990, partial [Citrobacter freundii]|uniref:hypothetical protein n=1 Tax=Citrobacter freundii TaxID=546 RepID=UPI0011392CFF
DALRMNMMISYQELVRTFPERPFCGIVQQNLLIISEFHFFPFVYGNDFLEDTKPDKNHKSIFLIEIVLLTTFSDQ